MPGCSDPFIVAHNHLKLLITFVIPSPYSPLERDLQIHLLTPHLPSVSAGCIATLDWELPMVDRWYRARFR